MLFEQSILSILPSVLLLIFVPFRIWSFRNEAAKARWGGRNMAKQVIYILLFMAQLTALVFTKLADYHIKTAIPSLILAAVVTIALNWLSLGDHFRSPHSSDGVNVYLFFSIIFDGVQVRTLLLRSRSTRLQAAMTIILALKTLLFLAEVQGKQKLLLPKSQDLSIETRSGVFARRSFWWLNGLLLRGYRTFIRHDQLGNFREDLLSSHAARRLEHAYDKFTVQHDGGHTDVHKTTTDNTGRRRLMRSCATAFKWSLLAPVPPRMAMIALRYLQPILFNAIITFMQTSTDKQRSCGYGLIAATGMLYLSLTVASTYYQHKNYQVVVKIRGTLVSLLYSKTLASAPQSLEDRAPVTLMSVDVDGITGLAPSIHEFWASPVELGIAMWLLQRQIGIVCVAPVVIALLCTGSAVWVSQHMGVRQAIWNKATQERISATSSILHSMKSIKFMGFARFVMTDIRSLRDAEIHKMKLFRRLTVFINLLANIPAYASPIITFAIFVLLPGSAFSISKAFTSLTLIVLVENAALSFIASLVPLATATGCFNRLETFFESTNGIGVDPMRPQEITIRKDSSNGIKTTGATERSGLRSRSESDRQAVFRIVDGALGVSSTKVSCLMNINLIVKAGSYVGVIGPVGCGKTLLLRALLGRLPNISGFKQFPHTSIAYCSQTPWLHNGTIRESIIGQTDFDELWYHRVIEACALTEDLRIIQDGDLSIVGSQGTTLSGGQKQRLALARAVYSRNKVLILDDVFSGMDPTTTSRICRGLFGLDGIFDEMQTTVILATHSSQALTHMQSIVSISMEGQLTQVSDIKDIEAPLRGNSYEDQSDAEIEHNATETTYKSLETTTELEELQHDIFRKSGDWKLYRHYIQSIGWMKFGILLAVSGVVTVFDNFPTVWLKQWSEAEEKSPRTKTSYYLDIYGAVSFAGLTSLIGMLAFLFLKVVPASGQALHTKLLDTVISAKQELNDKVDAGVTLNRFAQDIQYVDRDLPLATLRMLNASTTTIACAVLVCIGAPYMAITIPLLFICVLFLQKFYLRTSRQLRFLEIETRAPLYTLFTETTSGIDTIVAFGWQHYFQQKCFRLLDASQKPYYLLFCVQRWLIFVLGVIVSALGTLLVAFSMELRQVNSSGSVGVGLIAILGFNVSLNKLIVEWTNLETSLGAIARVKQFSEETALEEDTVLYVKPEWPSNGKIEFRNVRASYRSDLPPAIRDISFEITAGSKFGICGRTGSGKSSLIASLFRLLDLSSGSILIDGISHINVPLSALRGRILALPQQPYLLEGSIRRNMDPENVTSDEEICAVLEKVRLWDVVTSGSATAQIFEVLNTKLEADKLSPGQRQLLVLARAMLRRPRILVLDEATSSLDEDNDELMQNLIRDEFSARGCTVVAIAHRLKSIADFDQVVVLEEGRVVEKGDPKVLVREEDSVFGKMWREQGVRKKI